MMKKKILMLLVATGLLGGCENMSPGQKGALTGAALGTGIGMVAGGSFGAVVGAGLIGGAAGYITGTAVQDRQTGNSEMIARSFLTAAALLLLAAAAQAQMPPTNFDQAAYITCKEAHAMQPEARKALALLPRRARGALSRRDAPRRAEGAQVAYLVRGGCTLAPDAYLFTVIDRAIIAEASKLPKRQ